MGGDDCPEQCQRLRAARPRFGVVDDELLAGCGADVEGLHPQRDLADLGMDERLDFSTLSAGVVA